MSKMEYLLLPEQPRIQMTMAGHFVAMTEGRHVTRVMDTYELILVEKHTYPIYENDREFSLQPGDTLLLWPNRLHGGFDLHAPGLRAYWVHFYLSVKESDAEPLLQIPQNATLDDPTRLIQLFRWLLDDLESGRLTPASAGWLISLMLHEVAYANRSTKPARAGAMLARRAHEVVHTRYAEPIGTSDVACDLECNPDYLGRVYQREYGMSITEALHKRRMQMAVGQLLEGQLSVTQIAHACGFADPAYFRRLFYRYHGISPLAYRRRYARMPINS